MIDLVFSASKFWWDWMTNILEVKGARDTLHESLFSHVNHFVRRLNLDYSFAVVVPS
jgi:hypothetical protein